jgi:hypothetical protein
MTRERLTKRAAEAIGDKGTGIMNDPYQVNNPEHEKNDPNYSEYAKGDPSAWAEDVVTDLPGGPKDKRIPDLHVPEITAKMAAEAIQAGRKLEEKAVKCIVASQRILPGAADPVIESQAADLMHLPDNMVDSLLGRQEELANTIAKAASDSAEESKEEKKEEGDKKEEKDSGEIPEGLKKFQEEKKEEGKKEDDKKEEKEKDSASECKEEKKDEDKKEEKKEEKDAAMSPEEKKAWGEKMKKLRDKKAAVEAEIAELEKSSASEEDKKEEKKEEDKKEEKDAGSEEKKEEDKKEDKEAVCKEEKAEEKAEEKEKDASQTLLDDIFSGVIASDTKKGAKSLSGLVKKEASETSSDPLSGVWRTDPDVSEYFK